MEFSTGTSMGWPARGLNRGEGKGRERERETDKREQERGESLSDKLAMDLAVGQYKNVKICLLQFCLPSEHQTNALCRNLHPP